MSKDKINPELKKGDRVSLISMGDESSLSYGDSGKVTSKVGVFGVTQYGVNWDKGSTLNLLADEDFWMLEDDFKNLLGKKKIKENKHIEALGRSDSFTEFNMKFLYEYMNKLRESSVVNMLQSQPFLYMGSDRMRHEFKYKEVSNEEAFEEVINMSDQAQAEMVQGVMNVLEKEGKEPDLDNINRYLRRFSQDILQNYIYIKS